MFYYLDINRFERNKKRHNKCYAFIAVFHSRLTLNIQIIQNLADAFVGGDACRN